MDEGGYFTIVDRMKDMILTAGFNVYPAEIERVLRAHPAVALAAVGGIPDETKGELAKAYVVLKPGTGVTREELITHCRGLLAAYKVPRAIQFTTEVPMTSVIAPPPLLGLGLIESQRVSVRDQLARLRQSRPALSANQRSTNRPREAWGPEIGE